MGSYCQLMWLLKHSEIIIMMIMRMEEQENVIFKLHQLCNANNE